MADDKDSAPRVRPFTPPLPPFRGSATALRPPIKPITPPDGKRGALFIGTRAPSTPVADATPAVIDIATLASVPAEKAHASATMHTAQLPEMPDRSADWAPAAQPDTQRADVIAATEAMPWLFADPGASQPVNVDPADADLHAPEQSSLEGIAPERGPSSPDGSHYLDAGDAARDSQQTWNAEHSPGAAQAADVYVATVLESMVARVRVGDIDVSSVDPKAGEAAALAAVLAALLRQRAR